jgi:TonB family protein
MKPCTLWRYLVVSVVAAMFCPSQAFCQQVGSPTPAQAAAAESYPNTPDGLRQLLIELLRLAKTGDQAKLRTEIAEMEIPNFKDWFAHAFGQENGQQLGDKYEKSLKASELQFEMLWIELAKQQGLISVNRFDPQTAFGIPSGTLDAYRADWKKTDNSAGPDNQSIGVFYLVGGRFRLDGSRHDVRVLSTNKTGPVTVGKLANRIPPVYPPLARQARIQGTVAVNVIVRKDGTVEVQNVGAGHPLLIQAAVDAVKQWRYEPTTVNGEPVDIQTKIYVFFALNK